MCQFSFPNTALFVKCSFPTFISLKRNATYQIKASPDKDTYKADLNSRSQGI